MLLRIAAHRESIHIQQIKEATMIPSYILRFVRIFVALQLFLSITGPVSYPTRSLGAPPTGHEQARLRSTPMPTETEFSDIPLNANAPTSSGILMVTPTPAGALAVLPTPPPEGQLTSPAVNQMGTLPQLNLPSVRGFNVTEQTGAVNINIPLNLPPGVGGFAPQLSISYSSSAVDDIQGDKRRTEHLFQSGILGLGWSISGIPSQSIMDWFDPNYDGNGQVRGWARVIHLSGIGPTGSVELSRRVIHNDDPVPPGFGRDTTWYQTPAANLQFDIYDEPYPEDPWNPAHMHYRTYVSRVVDASGRKYIFDAGTYQGHRYPHFGPYSTFTIRDRYPYAGGYSCAGALGTVYVKEIEDVWGGSKIKFSYHQETRPSGWGATATAHPATTEALSAQT
jgi:hypothetical protein